MIAKWKQQVAVGNDNESRSESSSSKQSKSANLNKKESSAEEAHSSSRTITDVKKSSHKNKELKNSNKELANDKLKSKSELPRKSTDAVETADEQGEEEGMSFESFLTYDSSAAVKQLKKKTVSKNGVSNTSKNIDKAKYSDKNKTNHESVSNFKKSGHEKHQGSSHKSSHKDKHGHSKHHKHSSHDDDEHSHNHGSQSDKHSSHKDRHGKHSDKDKSNHSHSHKHKHKHSHKESSSHSSASRHDKSGEKSERKKNRVAEKRKADELVVPAPTKQLKLTPSDILATLPELQPVYKPLPHIDLDSPTRKKKGDDFDINQIGTKSHSRTAVYAGRKMTNLTEVPRLYDACMQVLIDNIDSLEYVGGVPYDILKPVLEKCTPTQLFELEDYNPHFTEDTDELWFAHCQRDFRACKPVEMESWRELYLRKHDEREEKLKKLTANIAAKNIARAAPVKKTKLAFVDSAVKPPRDVRRRQLKHGTAGPSKPTDPMSKLSSRGGTGIYKSNAPAPVASPSSSLGASLRRSQQQAPKPVAPMMQKSLKLMKNLKRR